MPISYPNSVQPSTFAANLVVQNTAPSLTLQDTTASAKSLLIKTDGDKSYLQELAGADGSLVTLDLANGRVGIGTTPVQTLDVAGVAQAQSFAFSGNANTWQLTGRGTDVATWGVPYFRSTVPNSPTALDIMPNGTGGNEATGLAWIDICNADLSPANSNNFQTLLLGARSDSFIIGSHAGGTGTDLPLTLGGSTLTLASKALAGTTRATISNLGFYISPSGTDRAWFTDGDIRLGSGIDFRWYSGAGIGSGSLDTGLARNAAGVVEINLGTQNGTFGDLKLRTIVATGVPIYANNAAAVAGGLAAGAVYRTNGDPDQLCIVH